VVWCVVAAKPTPTHLCLFTFIFSPFYFGLLRLRPLYLKLIKYTGARIATRISHLDLARGPWPMAVARVLFLRSSLV
jgi:hypothetical protein